MAFDVNKIIKGKVEAPRKVIISGPPKIGKSTLAAHAPNSLIISTEDRIQHIDSAKTETMKSYPEIMEVFEFLLKEKHDFKSLVVDTLDWFEPLLHAAICEKKGFKSLLDDSNKETNYGRGMKYHAAEGWKGFLHNCDILRLERDMNIILVSHTEISKVSPPDGESYDRYSLKIDKHAAAVCEEWADIIGFYNREITVKTVDAGFNKKVGRALEGNDKRILNLTATNPAWLAGNSYGLSDIEVVKDSMAEIMNYILTTNNN